MPKIDFIVGTSILVYFATTITEIVSSVPVGLTLSDFGGNCILSADTSYASNGTMFVTKFGSIASCEFCTYLTIVTVLYSLGYGCYSSYALYKSAENANLMWVLPAIMVCLLLLAMKFISSCILSVGFSQFCKSVSSPDKIKNCQAGQSVPKEWRYGTTTLDGGNYYTYMTTAQSASWFCMFEWFVLMGLGILHYRRNISIRSSGQVVGGFGASDTEGIVANEILPGS